MAARACGTIGLTASKEPTMRVCFGILFAVVLSVTDSQAARVPAPDPSQGDGGVSSFYTWNDGDIPPAPGQMLRTELLDPAL
jgi:hypothetical protein